MTADEIKAETTEELKTQLDFLREREPYFRWKMGTPPWCNDPKQVERYNGLIEDCSKEMELIELELKERGEL